MDIGGALLRTSGLTAGAPPELIGKWIQSAMRGELFVGNIQTSPGETVPLTTFLVYHYLIGVTLTFILWAIVSVLKISPVPWWLPLLYGVGTTLIPFFLMYPGMGFGVMGLKGPPEYLLVQTALLNHLFFGIGLMLSFRWLLRKRI